MRGWRRSPRRTRGRTDSPGGCVPSCSMSRRRHAPSRRRGWRPSSVDRVLMNPPFNDPARQRASPDRRRRLAHAGPGGTLAAWTKTAARLLRVRGTLTLIWRADGLAEILRVLDPAFGAVGGAADPSPARGAGDPHSRARDQGEPRAACAVAGPRAQRRFGAPHRRRPSPVLRGGAALPLSEI